MDSEGPGEPSGSDFVVQNRTGAVRHATVRCQTSTSTIFSEMIELDSGETAAYDDLPQELIELQVNVADGPKGSKMYDAETVPGTVAVGVTGSEVLFETTTDPLTSAAELDDVFDDGGIGASAAETADQSADEQGRDGTAADRESSGVDTASGGSADATDSARHGADSGGRTDSDGRARTRTDTTDADRSETGAASGNRTDRRAADAAGSGSPDASGRADRRSGSDAAGSTGSDGSAGSRRGSTGDDGRTPGSNAGGTAREADSDAGDAAETTPSGESERRPGPDEIHCRNCGEIIRANAEICPECGTRNAAQASRQAGQSAGASDADGTTGSDARSTGSGTPAADDPEREPGPEEIYCRNCGEIIRENAEICPECGVQNAAQAGAPPSGGSGAARASRGGGPAGAAQPSRATDGTAQGQSTASEPSGSWVNGVRFGALLWLLVLLILIPTVLQYQNVTAGSGVNPGAMLQSLGLATLLPPVQLLAWIVLPISLYFDLKYVDYHVDEWPLSGRLYIAAAAILPVLTQIFGAAALFIGGGAALAAIVPVLLLALSVRHLRTRSRLV